MRRLHFISSAIWSLAILPVVKTQDSSCHSLKHSNQTAYIEWPILFDLDDVINNCDDIYSVDADQVYIRSTISYRGSNDTLFDTGIFDLYGSVYPSWRYQIENVTYDTPDVEMTVRAVNSSACCTLKKNLKKEIFLPQTCQTDFDDGKNLMRRTKTEGDVAVFSCDVLDDSGLPNINMSQYVPTWYYECSTSLPDDVILTNDGNLRIGKMNHKKHPGLYSCSIVHNGQLRYIVHVNTCVEPDISSSEITVKCDQNEYFVDEGAKAEVSCEVDINEGRGRDMDYVLVFYPLHENQTQDLSKDNISCVAILSESWTFAPDKRISCSASPARNAPRDDFKCFYHIPTEKEWADERNKSIKRLKMTYRIENVQSKDFGFFWAIARTRFSRDSSISVFQISPKSHISDTVIIVGCVLGVAIVAVLVCLFIYCWRRSRSQPRAKTTGHKESGANRTYFWSKGKSDAD